MSAIFGTNTTEPTLQSIQVDVSVPTALAIYALMGEATCTANVDYPLPDDFDYEDFYELWRGLQKTFKAHNVKVPAAQWTVLRRTR